MHHQLANLFFALVLPCSLAMHAQAQSSCSSDGQARPRHLHERFISADCGDCWAAVPTAQPGADTLVLDWIVPSPQGDDAPLAAAASRDAMERLESVMARAIKPEDVQASQVHTMSRPRAVNMPLRVAHGLPVNDYLGTSVSLDVPKGRAQRYRGAVTAWLALVETIPAGTEGTPIERNLVRGVWGTPVDLSSAAKIGEQRQFFESRAMRIPQGAQAERLRVTGWLQEATGKLLAVAQSQCQR